MCAKNNIHRREFLSVSATTLIVVFSGCTDSGPEENSEYSCPDPFPVKVYNEIEKTESIMLAIRDNSDEVLFSDTIELEANTDPHQGTDLDVEIYDTQQYTFEVTSPNNNTISKTFEAKCGPIFVFINDTGKLEIRDDELDHLREN